MVAFRRGRGVRGYPSSITSRGLRPRCEACGWHRSPTPRKHYVRDEELIDFLPPDGTETPAEHEGDLERDRELPHEDRLHRSPQSSLEIPAGDHPEERDD